MRRTKTMLMGDLLEEFFKRPYVAAKVAEGKLPDTWREIVGDRAAIELAGDELRITHIGTDGAVLTWMGLPCPNLSTGGYNYHGVHEFIPVDSLAVMPDVLLEIIGSFVENV